MKIDTRKLRETLQIDLNGTEDWLLEIYESFEFPQGASRPNIFGQVIVNGEEHGYYQVVVKIQYDPFWPCSRCDKAIQWPMHIDTKVSFRKAPEDVAKEKILGKSELDEYYLDGPHLDVAALVNELIQLEIPHRAILQTEDGQHCRVCLDPIDHRPVYTTDSHGDGSAFSVLKGLKDSN